MDEKFMREKPVLPLLAAMAAPMALSMLVNSLYNIVDSFFVAQISQDAMTALSLVFPVQNFVTAVAVGFGVGMGATISFYLGAGQSQRANAAASRGFLLSALHGLVLTAAASLLTPFFLAMFTTEQQVLALGATYGRIVFAFSTVVTLGLSFEKLFQAVGSMKVAMVSLLCGCIANILLDPVLIFGWGPFPALGIAGAAWATVTGQVLTLLLYLVFYHKIPLPVRLGRRYLAKNWKLDAKLYAIGLPATLNLALPSLLVSALNAIFAAYSEIYVVILGIYYKLQTFLYLPANGVIQGMRPLIGYNYGAGEQQRVRRIYGLALAINGCIMALGTLVCWLAPDRLMALFTDQAPTVAAGAAALRIISAGFLVSVVSITTCGALEGLGMGAPSFLISLCRYAVVILPVALALSYLIGPAGVWHAFWLAEGVTAAFSLWLYRRTVLKIPGNQKNGEQV